MPIPESLTKVTPLSKTIALILFGFLPFIGFIAGTYYQKQMCPGITFECNPAEASEAQDDEDSTDMDEDGNPDSDDNADTEEEYDGGEIGDSTTEGWKTYTNSEWDISFDYPEDWTLDEELLDGEECTFTLVKVTKNEHTFNLSIPCASGPSLCSYGESEGDMMAEIVFDDYMDISGKNGSYRRSPTEEGDYSICHQSVDGGDYITWSDPGYITYIVPDTVNEDLLETLDEILISYDTGE